MPLAVRGDHVPRGGVAVAAAQGIAVRVQVVVPQHRVVDVARVELPVLRRVVEARGLAVAPLVERDVEEALDDRGAARSQALLEAVDGRVAPGPRGPRRQPAYADH